MNPFVFGKIVDENNFTDRKEDYIKIVQNMKGLTNTILISPRRWGKSSLMLKAAESFQKSTEYKVCFIDMFRISDEKDFYKVFSKSLIKLTSSKAADWTLNALELLSRLRPKVTVGKDPITDFDISLEFANKQEDYSDILNLPEIIAKKKNIKILICLDEFQNLMSFSKPLEFQKRLRSHWQRHKNTAYYLFGSKQHMMMELFTDQSKPFYKFGEVIFLDKIYSPDFENFIINKFKLTEKNITKDFAAGIINLMEHHPFYVQQLAFIIWNNTKKNVNKEIFDKSINDLITQNSLFFEKEYEKLSKHQILFLKALSEGVKSGFTTLQFINKYGMNNSSNVIKVQNALIDKEIIHKHKSSIEFLDPAFKLWMTKLFE
jgi:uncharacterized protein